MPISGFDYDVFTVSTTIYQVGKQLMPDQNTWADTGIAINITSPLNIGTTDNSNASIFHFPISLLLPGAWRRILRH